VSVDSLISSFYRLMSAFTKSGHSSHHDFTEMSDRFRPRADAFDNVLPHFLPVRMSVEVVIISKSLDVATVGVHDVDLLARASIAR